MSKTICIIPIIIERIRPESNFFKWYSRRSAHTVVTGTLVDDTDDPITISLKGEDLPTVLAKRVSDLILGYLISEGALLSDGAYSILLDDDESSEFTRVHAVMDDNLLYPLLTICFEKR